MHRLFCVCLLLCLLLVTCIGAHAQSSSSTGAMSSSSSTGAFDPTSVLTVVLSLSRDPNLPLPSNFSSVLLADLSTGLSVSSDRIMLGSLGGATQTVNGASVGTSITFSVTPASNSSAAVPSMDDVLQSIRLQYYNYRQSGTRGPLLLGAITQQLNTAYLVILSTGYANSSTGSSNSTATALPVSTSHVLLATLLSSALLHAVG